MPSTEPDRTATDIAALLERLGAGGVEFVVIGGPAGFPFALDTATLTRGLNFTLTTDIGAVDLLVELAVGGSYDIVVADGEATGIGGQTIRCVSLRRLIALKRAAGRPRDLVMLGELEALLDERESDPGTP